MEESSKVILLVDDSSTARMIIRRCLEMIGLFEIRLLEAADGKEALALARETMVDLVVTDINMPVMDGRALMRRIRSNPKLNHLPIIVMSSIGRGGNIDELMEAGANVVLAKPVSPQKLHQAFQQIAPGGF